MEHPQIISRENVRPSSPTPQNLRIYKVSMLDQVVPCVLVPVLLYYEDVTKINGSDSFISHSTNHLKNTLSTILSRFYPLAGRASHDNLSINCNDEGVPFIVAKFNGNLSDHLRDPSKRRFLLPCDDITKHDDRTVLQVQINHFDRSGVAVASVFWHRAADAPAFAAFLKSWAATARGMWDLPVCPNYIFPSLFPQAEDETLIQTHSLQLAAAIMRRGRSVLRRYVFDGAAVAALKKRSGLERCSRVEVVSALIWKCFMAASLANNNNEAPANSVLLQAVNLRRRARPPFPDDCFGNCQGSAATSSDGGGEDIGGLVKKMRVSLSKIDGDYVSRMSGDGGINGYVENSEGLRRSIAEGAEIVYVSSWCNLGFNGVDFGWGKPIRVGTYGGEGNDAVFANGVSLMDSGEEGIEVGMIIDERYVTAFENADQLLRRASIDDATS